MFVRVNSHRARDKMQRALGHMPDGYFSLHFDGEFRNVTPGEFEKIKNVTGISRAKVNELQLLKCWSMY